MLRSEAWLVVDSHNNCLCVFDNQENAVTCITQLNKSLINDAFADNHIASYHVVKTQVFSFVPTIKMVYSFIIRYHVLSDRFTLHNNEYGDGYYVSLHNWQEVAKKTINPCMQARLDEKRKYWLMFSKHKSLFLEINTQITVCFVPPIGNVALDWLLLQNDFCHNIERNMQCMSGV